jgi:23S rRNA pseudouridine2605 synthase
MARDQKPTRLNKFLAECGVASRRHADQLISEGAVLVNGKKVYELGTRVSPSDRITVNGKPVKTQGERVYLLFNKPKHVVTTMNDPEGRPSIADYFQRLPVRVFPVGRLDWDSEGMILLTNDGDFAQAVNHPTQEIVKTYMVKVSGRPTDEQLTRLRTGVSIPTGRVSAKVVERARSKGSTEKDWIRVGIAEGKNRQIRFMFEKIGFDVLKLQRIAIGHLKMPTTLERGEFVFLTEMGLKKIFEQDKKEQPKEKRVRSAKTDARDKASRAPGAKARPAPSKREGGRQERGRPTEERPARAESHNRTAAPAARPASRTAARPGARPAARPGARPAGRTSSRPAERPASSAGRSSSSRSK